MSITNGELRNVTQPPPGEADDDCDFSENGRCIAFVRWPTSGLGSMWSTGVLGQYLRLVSARRNSPAHYFAGSNHLRTGMDARQQGAAR